MASRAHLEIVGLINKHHFQIAKGIAEGLKNKYTDSFDDPVFRPLLECDWHEYLSKKKMHIFVYMDIETGGEAAGRLLFELFSDLCPKTCRNFKALCTGEAGMSKSNLELSYKGSIFHRVVPNGWVQGGDISPGRKGNGGESIYGPTFEDENFVVSHNKRGILGMVNRGPHSNGSQFYITLQPVSWMDYKYVAFGQLVEGTEVLKRLEEVPTYNERPKQDCVITACGVIEP
ncbi:probable inactive peptidyl-prolyl cis-trans isomerase-like 6 isoform X2 [Misgurnus anguillicaudatus]|uniref:probable inactive peptidyl-prolyl cis-trans isomerase-like 6 isoform X2 n=1 Tax=Misgurnus anguillicaudatus TaxID=75329 RepID=UPI00243502BB|nr:probable inactive peptidyl-prolyl cis-trans isomerase-like 6 isoform X2 [Misgurnus anguillicaudatus]